MFTIGGHRRKEEESVVVELPKANETMPIIATSDKSFPVNISASNAPTPADGSVDKIVKG